MDALRQLGFQTGVAGAYPAPMPHQDSPQSRCPASGRRLGGLVLVGLASATGAGVLAFGAGLSAFGAGAPAQASSPAPDRSWIHESSAAFEERLRSADPDTWDAEFEAALWTALRGAPRGATRAALLLAHDPSNATSEGLLQLLEERTPYAERPADAGACTAATCLATRELSAAQLDRLEDLALDAPHPDLEVRTECAISAFTHGRRSAGRFLIRVLRIDTPSEQVEGALTDSTTTAWCRGRAGTCLTDALGLPRQNWTDASLEERQRRADELSRLLGEPDPCLTR